MTTHDEELRQTILAYGANMQRQMLDMFGGGETVAREDRQEQQPMSDEAARALARVAQCTKCGAISKSREWLTLTVMSDGSARTTRYCRPCKLAYVYLDKSGSERSSGND